MAEVTLSTTSADASSSDPLESANLTTGGRWRGHYQVGDPLPDQAMGRSFKAIHLGTMQEVIIRSFRVNDGVRAKAWEAMKSLGAEQIVECVEAFENDGRRVEVTALPPAMSMRDWVGVRKAGIVEVKLVLVELSRILSALHEIGVAHLGIKLEKIYVASMDGGIKLRLGGLEGASLIQQDGLVAAVVNPFYAPPECVGLYQHSPGRGLKAWDWWSFGRVLQEMTLGKHVLGHILDRDVSRQTPELLTRAEALLGEQDDSGLRAGAVECMPPMDKDLHTLLKGLLTSCRDARWGYGEITRWLANDAVKERYQLPKNERLFIWKDRAFTVSEAAEFFGTSENWKDGLFNLFTPADSRTLLYFLNEVPGMHKTKEKIDAFLKLKDGMALATYATEVKQDLIACITWGHLAAGTAKPRLFGRELNATCVAELLAPEMLPLGLSYLKGLLTRAILQHIEQQDSESSRFLQEYDKLATAAVTLAKNNQWIVEDNHAEVAKIMRNCLEKEAELRKQLDVMRKDFACTRIIVLDRVFKKAVPTLAELAVLAFTGTDTARFEYVTHAEYNTEHLRILRERGERLQKALTWLNLERAQRAGPLVFGHWRLSAIVWGVLIALIAMTRQWVMLGLVVLVPVAFLAACKWLWLRLNRKVIEEQLPPDKPWRFLDGSERSRSQALIVLDVAAVPEVKELRKNFKEVNEEIKKLPLSPPPEKIKAPRRCYSTWLIIGCSWVIVAGAFLGTAWTVWNHPPQLPRMVTSIVSGRKTDEEPDLRNLKPQEGRGFGKAISPDKDKGSALSEEEIAEENASLQAAMDKLRKLQEEEAKLPKPPPKIAWRFKPAPNPQIVNIRGVDEASPSQEAQATDLAKMTLNRFNPDTINAVVAIRVSTDKGVGIMLWDGKGQRLINRSVIKMSYVPLARTWLDVGGQKVFYLGQQ
jgi:serine/threonine protein kinase